MQRYYLVNKLGEIVATLCAESTAQAWKLFATHHNELLTCCSLTGHDEFIATVEAEYRLKQTIQGDHR